MLERLRRIVQQVAGARSLGQALELIVEEVRGALGTDVCSIYLAERDSGRLVLMATRGLAPQAVGRVALGPGEGLVGLVAARAEPVNLEDAPSHPHFKYIAETGEAPFHAFLGVPVIHQRRVRGVLVVQQRERRRFDEDHVTFLVTLAAQLAGVIAHAEAVGGLDLANGEGAGAAPEPAAPPRRRMLEGLPGAPGVAFGTAVVVYPPAELDAVPDRPAADAAAEEAAFREAVAAVTEEFRQLQARLGPQLRAEDRALFDAYILMLSGDSLVTDTVERIRAGSWAPGALRETIEEHARVFDAMDDPYLRERAADVRDLGRRILAQLQAARRESRDWPERTVLVGEQITAADLGEVPAGRLAAIVSAHGSRSSHVAILARALGIPAVMGVAELPIQRLEGREVVVDGYRGRLHVQPTGQVREEFLRLAREEEELRAGLSELAAQPSVTPEGEHVPLLANTGLLADITPSLSSGAEGIGLYRTEIPFLMRERFPGEEEQRRIYRQVLEAFAPRPVTLRTLDVGGDKSLAYFPVHEANPFLGWRGIRITLDHPEIFLTQLRAMLRASAGLGNLQILLPMVSGVEEVDDAVLLIRRAREELAEEGEAVPEPRVGVMVEVPSAVYMARQLAARVDFLSIGTNDLVQYLLAVDRNNERVAELYEPFHPAVLAAVQAAVDGGHAAGRPVSVCGEMAGDPAAALLLLGMGVDSLSMSASSLPRVKWVVRSFTRAEARALLEEARALEHPYEVRERVEAALEARGLGGLVRAGK